MIISQVGQASSERLTPERDLSGPEASDDSAASDFEQRIDYNGEKVARIFNHENEYFKWHVARVEWKEPDEWYLLKYADGDEEEINVRNTFRHVLACVSMQEVVQCPGEKTNSRFIWRTDALFPRLQLKMQLTDVQVAYDDYYAGAHLSTQPFDGLVLFPADNDGPAQCPVTARRNLLLRDAARAASVTPGPSASVSSSGDEAIARPTRGGGAPPAAAAAVGAATGRQHGKGAGKLLVPGMGTWQHDGAAATGGEGLRNGEYTNTEAEEATPCSGGGRRKRGARCGTRRKQE